jgi:hypothetical protein
MKIKDVRKAIVSVVGVALTVGLSLGLTGRAQEILVSVAGLATALGVYGVRNGDKPAPTKEV